MTDVQDSATLGAQPGDLPPAITKVLRRIELEPSRLCARLLYSAATLSKHKKNNRNEVSCSTVFLAALRFLEEQRVDSTPHGFLGDPDGERTKLENFVSSVKDLGGVALDKLYDDYFANLLDSQPDSLSDLSKIQISDTLESALADDRLRDTVFPSDTTIFDAPALLLAVLSNKKALLQTRLKQLGISIEPLIRILVRNAPSESTIPFRETTPTEPATHAEGTGTLAFESATTPQRPRDFRTRIDRDPNDPNQLSLGISVYAAALATMLRTATGEFCFALFGPWGIGKTRLVRSVAPLLTSPEKYKEALLERGYAVGEGDDDKLRYEVVWYSAWKFRRPPEAWIFLYETMAMAATNVGLFLKFGRVLRAGVVRHGYWPLITGLISLGVVALPFYSRLQLLGVAIELLGIGGLIYGSGVIRRGRETVRSLATRYGALTHHGERLGMQALIGQDLRALLLGWIPSVRAGNSDDELGASNRKTLFYTIKTFIDHILARLGRRSPETASSSAAHNSDAFSKYPWLYGTVILGAFAAICIWALGYPFSNLVDLKGALQVFCGNALESKSFWCQVGQPEETSLKWPIIVFSIWALTCLLVLWTVHRAGRNTNRILLVIDDLDRCSPSEVIDIAESLKLLLEDNDIKQRVQVLMLVDEDILEHAISNKFAPLIQDRVSREGTERPHTARQDVVREHVEKLFACHLRLPPINNKEIAELAHLYSQVDVQRHNDLKLKEIEAALSQLPAPERPPVRGPREPVEKTKWMRDPQSGFQRAHDGPTYSEITSIEPAESDEAFAKRQAAYDERRNTFEEQKRQLLEEVKRLAPADVITKKAQTDMTAPATLAGSQLRFDEHEVGLLTTKLAAYMQRGGRRPSPRAIRTFLFKYQLCRLLLQLSQDSTDYIQKDAEPEKILDALAMQCFNETAQRRPLEYSSRATLQCIIAQVA